nr:PepSY domain-containing protein [Microbacterium testaceum]
MSSTRIPAFALLALSSVLALSACTPASDDATAPGSSGSRTSSSGATAVDDGRTVVTVINTAEASAGGRAFQLERDDDEWEVHVAVGDREVEVHVASDGTTVRSSNDDDGIDADERSALDAAVTTLADAVRIATTQHAGGERLAEVQLDERDGTWAWEVGLSGGTTVRVSAADGAVL